MAEQTRFAYRGELICHGLALLALEGDQCLARVQAVHIARQRNDLHTIQIFIGRVITENDGWTLFANFATDRRVEVDLPDLTAVHR
jgi:hypothetical protein